ncbi:MAG: hypothetical protein HY525_10005 [Betaproteobacteria bacterium]|nr:hypothetical protein [Betaproteobacteria bacterium]
MDIKLVEGQLQQVLEKMREGDLDSSAALLDRILDISVDHPDLLRLGAIIALRRRRLDAADQFSLRAMALRPDSPAVRDTRVQVLAALQQNEEELTELRQVLRIDPGCHKAHVRIWEIMGECGRIGELTALIKRRLIALDAQGSVEPRPTRVRIPDTTLCCADCSNHALAIRALKLTLSGCEFPRAIFFTDREFDIGPIETVIIDPIQSLHDYALFVMKRLLPYIDTDYVLLVQWDGYVVNADAWSDQFLLFDYIGARWPHEALNIPADHAVGNGGFSLRSKTLLQALQDPRVVAAHPEDGAICLTHRQYLERQYGVAFAPDAIADRFSFEHIESTAPTFGFHGQINITRFVDDEAIRLLRLP